MKIGVFSILYNERPLEQLLPYFSKLGVEAVEIGIAGYSKSKHCDVEALLADDAKCAAYKKNDKRQRHRNQRAVGARQSSASQ